MRQTIKTCWNRILKSFAYNIRTKTSISLFYRFEFGLCILLKWFLFKRPHPSICIFLLQTFILFTYLASVHLFFFFIFYLLHIKDSVSLVCTVRGLRFGACGGSHCICSRPSVLLKPNAGLKGKGLCHCYDFSALISQNFSAYDNLFYVLIVVSHWE